MALILGTKANALPVLSGSVPDTQLVLVPDPTSGELKRTTFGQIKADIVLAIGDLSYLDDIIEKPTIDDLPQPGETKKIYVITSGPDANKQFRWGGSIYIEFPQGSGDVAGEAIIRGNADSALQANINAETAARIAADSTLQNNINSEATFRNNADIILQGNISSEANTRSTNDAILQGLINTEGTTRAAADNALSDRIEALEEAGVGTPGADGKSAYEIAVENGFEGTEEEWLLSLKGEQGEPGPPGADGEQGPEGPQGPPGEDAEGGGGSPYAVASGTNTYAATFDPVITALTEGLSVRVKFTNANTGASTFNADSTGAKNIYKGGTNALVANDISAGQIIGLVYDGTYWQLQGSTQAFPSTPNKVITTNGSGVLQATNDLIDVNSTTTEATLIAATWTDGVATATGTPGTWVLGTTSHYLYICTGTNTWVRIPCYLDYVDVYLGSVSDSGGVKTSAQMAALYPAAIRGQWALGTNGKYEYMGMVGWFYYANSITP